MFMRRYDDSYIPLFIKQLKQRKTIEMTHKTMANMIFFLGPIALAKV